MEHITLNGLKDILYDDNDNPTEVYNMIKSIFNENIQIGGGIEIEQEFDIITLFDDKGYLTDEAKEILGGGEGDSFFDIFKTDIQILKNFYKEANEFNKECDNFVNSRLLNFKNRADKLSYNIYDEFIYYFQNAKYRALLLALRDVYESETDLSSLPENTPDTEKLRISYELAESKLKNIDNLANEIEIKLRGSRTAIMYAYKIYKRDFKKSKWKAFKKAITRQDYNYFKLIKDSLAYLREKQLKLREKYERETIKKIVAKYNKKVALGKLNKGKETINNIVSKIDNVMNENTNIISSGNQMLVDILNTTNGIEEYKEGIIDNEEIYENILNNTSIIIKGFNTLIVKANEIKSNIKGLLQLFEILRNTTKTIVINQGKNTNFDIALDYLFNELIKCNEINESYINSLVECQDIYIYRSFPVPNLHITMSMLLQGYKAVEVFYNKIDKYYRFLIKDNKVDVSDEAITKFIKNINNTKPILGGNIHNKLIQYGGANYNNSVYMLHSYDMYYLFNEFNILRGMQTYLRRNPRYKGSIYNIKHDDTVDASYSYQIDEYFKYDSDIDIEDSYYSNNYNTQGSIIGLIMVTKEIDYLKRDRLHKKFLSKLRSAVNIVFPSFIGIYLNGKIHIHLISFNHTGSINMDDITEFVSIETPSAKSLYYKVKIGNNNFYAYIPEKIYEPEFNNIDPKLDDEGKEALIDELKNKPFFIPFFIKFDSLSNNMDYEKTRTNPTAKLSYDIYLPYDTIFKRLLLPYLNLGNNSKYFKYEHKDKSLKELIPYTSSININILALKPDNINTLTNKIKFVLFFANNNARTNGELFDQLIYNKIRATLTNYFYWSNENITGLLNVNDIKKASINVNYDYIIGNLINKKPHIFNNDIINYETIKNMFALNNDIQIEKHIKVFKYILYSSIKKIDPTNKLLKGITSLDTIKIQTETLSSPEKNIFTTFKNNIELLRIELELFLKIKKHIEGKENSGKIIADIIKSITALQKLDNDKINKIIKTNKYKLPEIKSVQSYFKTINDNPQFVTPEKLLNLGTLLNNVGNSITNKYVEDLIFITIAENFKSLDKETSKEFKLKQFELMKTSGKEGILKIKKPTARALDSIDEMIPVLITETGAKAFISQLTEFKQEVDAGVRMSDIYKNSRFSYNQLKDIYKYDFENNDINIEKNITILTNYLKLKLGNTNEEFNNTMKNVYKPYIEKFNDDIDAKLEKAEKDYKDRKDRGFKPYNPDKSSNSV